MKKITCLLYLLLTTLVLSATNIPLVSNIYNRQNICLNGKWNYVIDPLENGYYGYRLEVLKNGFFQNRKPQNPQELVEYNLDTSPIMDIPSDWNTKESQLFFYEGTVWFKKDFTLKKESDKKYVLYFGAANYDAKVYVNGTKVGEHVGGYTPFNFDVTDQVAEGNNFVVVKVDNKRHKDNVPTVNMDWWNYGGLTRDVVLSVLPSTYVEDYFMQLPKGDTNTISGWVALNEAVAGQKITVEIPELKLKVDAMTDSEGKATFAMKAKPVLWSPENPKLYEVIINKGDDKLVDQIGFRTIETKGKQILLNGKHTFLRGVSLHEEAPFGQGRAWTKEHATTLLTWAKDMGCNYVRLAHYPHNEHMVREAERLGLLVWSEVPVYWTISFENEQTYQNAQNQLHEMISRDRNRCAVIIWSIANETPHGDGRDKFLSRLSTYARTQDNTRLISMAMEVTQAANNVNQLNDNMNEYVDVISFNQYVGWYRATNDAARTMSWVIPYDKPVIISEFGGDALQGLYGKKDERWTEDYQEELYIRNLEMLDKIDGLSGLSPWILVDFRSPRRQLPGIQDFYNRKGLVSDQGIKKKAFYVMQDFYEKKKEQFNKKTDK